MRHMMNYANIRWSIEGIYGMTAAFPRHGRNFSAMKVFQIVGVRKSGKTTTVERLIGKLKQKGYSVGTVKCINCPVFSLDGNTGSNTARHAAAGADVVAAFGRKETDFIFPGGQDMDRTLSIMYFCNPDFCIVEGGYEYNLPRIVCLRSESELSDRLTEKTFAVSGVLADTVLSVGELPALSALTDDGLDKLVSMAEKNVPELILPVGRLPRPESCRNFCRGCAKHAAECPEEK